MSTEQWGLIVGVLSMLLAAGAVYFARRSSRSGERAVNLSEEQLRLAREQAEMRPELVVSMHDTPFTWGRGQVANADAVLHFEIINTGKTTAHYVYCDLQFEEMRLVDLLHGHPSHYQIGIGDLSPTQEVPYRLPLDVRVKAGGLARVRYRCWCDELPTIEGDIEFEVPPKESAPSWLTYDEKVEPLPDFAIDKTWDSTLRVGERVTLYITATNQGGTALQISLWDELPATMRYVSHMGTDVGGGTPSESFHDPYPAGTIAGNAICRYEIVRSGESVTMDVTVIPTEVGSFINTIYAQYNAKPTDRGSSRVSKDFGVVVLGSYD